MAIGVARHPLERPAVAHSDQPETIMNGLLPIDFFAVTLFLGLLGLAVVTDLAEMRIPNRICLCIAALYPVHVLASAAPIDWLGAMGVAAIVFLGGLIPFIYRLMGGGDVKLMAAAALWAGPGMAIEFVLVTTFLGGVMALIMVSPYRYVLANAFNVVGRCDIGEVVLGRAIPYAVAIAAGAYLTVGPELLSAIG